MKTSDAAIKFLLNPIESLFNSDNESQISFVERLTIIDNIIDKYITEINLNSKDYDKFDHDDTMVIINKFFSKVREFLDPTTLKVGDYNMYDVNYITSFVTFNHLKNTYSKAIKGILFDYNDYYYEKSYSKICNCRDCGRPVVLDYGQVMTFKNLIDKKNKKGKQFHWPTRCQICKRIKKNKKMAKNPKLNSAYRAMCKANADYYIALRDRYIKDTKKLENI